MQLAAMVPGVRAAADADGVSQTKKKDTGSLFTGAGCGFSVFIAAPCCFAMLSRSRQPGALPRFDLGRGNERRTEGIKLLRASGSFGSRLLGCEVTGSLGQRRGAGQGV